MKIFGISVYKWVTFFVVSMAVPSLDLLAQPANRAVVTQPTEWFAFTSTMKAGNKINIYADAHFRYVQAFEPAQYQLRIAGEWVISKTLSVVPVGLVYVKNFQYGEQPATYVNDEHRIYQQAVIKHALGKFSFNHRIRFEERFIQMHHKETSGEIIDDGYSENKQFRIRYRGMINYPLNSEKIEPHTLFASVYDEVFMSWGKRVTFHEPDQNRIFAGLGYQFSKSFSIQSGFFYQMLIKANGAQQENNVGIMTQLSYNFDLTKKHD